MTFEKQYDAIIIGAGAAGMLAAIVAAQNGRRVLLIEKMEQAGRKLRITGKGRCNLTNTLPIRDFLSHVGSDSRFLRNAFSVFFSKELMQFFEEKGVDLVVERGNRVFPASGKAQDIFMGLINAIESLPIEVLKNQQVNEILTENNEVCGVKLKSRKMFGSPKVLLATGGRSYPLTGSTGDGYALAQQLGHTVTETFPALVPLVCKEKIPPSVKDFLLKNVRQTTFDAETGKKIDESFGEMTFTEDGVSGALILSLSRVITQPLHKGKTFLLSLDFKSALETDVLDKRLIKDLNENGNRTFKEMLRLWLPAQLVELALQNIFISEYKLANQLNGNDRKTILKFLKQFTLTITGTRSFAEAIVTQGGVSLKEINPKTMESKLVKGLYFAGEVMDLDADTGGYNLQIAFSTAYVAAQQF